MGKLGEWLKAAVWHATHPLAGMVTVVVALILLVGAVKAGVALAMPALLAAVVFGGLNMSLGQEWWLGELAPRHGPLLANLTSTLGALPEGRTVQAGGGSRYAAWRQGRTWWFVRWPGASLDKAGRAFAAGAVISTVRRETYLLQGGSYRLYLLEEDVPVRPGADGRPEPEPWAPPQPGETLWRMLRQRYAGVYVPVDQLAVLVTELVEAERGVR